MTVTKQQQLEWLAEKSCFTSHHVNYVVMSNDSVGLILGSGTSDRAGLSINCHVITRAEWQQERGKMQKQSTQDNSWHERGELPPCGVPVELWFGGSFAYNCEFIVMRGNTYVMWNLDADRPDAADYMNSQFRPCRTEREKAIDAACKAIGGVGEDGLLIIERLYDAGMLK